MPESLKVAVIGAGIGRAHVEGYLAAGAQVAAICDLNLEKSRALAQRFGIAPQITGDYHQILENEQIRAISLCTPNFLHAPMAMEALRAGKAVLCEKPLALNAVDAQKIADCARETGQICMVGQVLRFRDDTRLLKRQAAEIGPIYYARALARRISGIPKWGGWFTQKAKAGGGPLIDVGVHMIDLAWWLAGCPRPIAASGATYGALGARKIGLGAGGAGDENGVFDVEDLAAGLVRFEGGFTVHFEAAWALRAEKDERFCHLHGENGALLWADEPKFLDENGEIERLEVGAGTPWKNEMAHFLKCVQSGETPDPDAHQGVVMMKILDALYQSARENREISIV